MPAWRGDLQDRPAALDEAREAAELAAARARQAAEHGQAETRSPRAKPVISTTRCARLAVSPRPTGSGDVSAECGCAP
jgi:hypothetical protein